MLVEDLNRAISRCSVDDDMLDVGVGLRSDGAEGVSNRGRAIVAYGDERNLH